MGLNPCKPNMILAVIHARVDLISFNMHAYHEYSNNTFYYYSYCYKRFCECFLSFT